MALWIVYGLLGAGLAWPQPTSRPAVYRNVKVLTELGRRLFFDPALSASGQLSCASCHDPMHAYGPPDGSAVRLGGADMRQPGLRAVPSLRYLQAVPQFTEHYFESDDDGDASIDNGPTGGLTWDGRVNRGRNQARLPLLSPHEMANDTPSAVVAKTRAASYAGMFRSAFGAAIFADSGKAFDGLTRALEAYEQLHAEFYPYNSKYDAYLAGATALSEPEKRGLALFNDPEKGNCAHCHVSARGRDGTPPQFTDYGFAALGVPRNPAIAANADPDFFDLGLCGPLRSDFRDRPDYCGMFKAPSLRNVATRRSFFHNGVVHTLKDAVRFYAERDTNPEKWYPRGPHGTIRTFDDLPPAYHANVNIEPPFDRKLGDRPALSGAEIDDIVAFLATLTDDDRWISATQRRPKGSSRTTRR